MSNATASPPERLSLAEARVAVFREQYGYEALDLAAHAAFPLTLTTELVYCLRENFLRQEYPWYAAADVLLSGLCNPIGHDLYEMEGETRNYLLCYLTEVFGESRLDELEEFMLAYIQQQIVIEKSERPRVLGDRPHWTALAYLRPNGAADAVQAIQQELQKLALIDNPKERFRLAALVESYADLLSEAGFKPLLVQWAKQVAENQPINRQAAELAALIDAGFPLKTIELEVATISFEGDEPTDENELQPFDFDTVIIQDNGRVVRWWMRQGWQFIEPLPTVTVRKAGDETGLLFVEAKFKDYYQGERKLPKAEKKVFRGVWNELPYDEIYKLVANDGSFSPTTLREEVFLDLAEALSEILGATVTEDNLAETVQRAIDEAGGFELKTDLEMVAIPGGEFLMGSADNDPQGYSDERPQHKVKVAPFFMSKYPVTQAQWMAIVSWAGEETDLKVDPARFKGMDRPVEQVSWYDAETFCQLLSSYTGRTYRLPTEAEWEYACRAETTTAYCFGDTLTTELANYDQNIGETTPVDQFHPNPFGLYDMHGNVWEWCLDHWHENYKGAPTNGTAWLSSDESARRVRRGGSWYESPRNCRSAYRDYDYPGYRYLDLGFRVMCEARRT